MIAATPDSSAAEDIGQRFPLAGIHAGETHGLAVGADAENIAADARFVHDDGADKGRKEQNDQADRHAVAAYQVAVPVVFSAAGSAS